MTHRQRLVEQVMRHEGHGPMHQDRHMPYVDTVGKWTLGYGRNISDNGISSAEAMILLEHDLDEAIADCATLPWFLSLDEVRQRAVTDLRFNVGSSRFRGFKKMIAAFEVGDFDGAAAEMLDSKAARQLPARYNELAVMVATGQDDR